jgi:uncharacterized RDD family membrane protein YckC
VFCSKCGNEFAAGAAFCPRCGQPTYSAPAAPSNPGMAYAAAGAVAPAVIPQVYYAGFWLRVVAYLIDSVIVCIGFVALLIPLAILTGVSASAGRIHPWEDPEQLGALLGFGFIFGFIVLAIVGGWLYYALSESSSWQATLGKRMLDLKVTDMAGQPISFGRASGRHFGKIITGMIPLGIGWMLAGFTQKKQALHDMIASCLVLRRS